MNDPKGKPEGQVAIVTGGTSGIGRAVCLALAREGAAVVIVGRNKNRVAATAAEVETISTAPSFQRPSLGLRLDVRLEEDMGEMAKQTLIHFGRIDILVTSAGILRAKQTRPTMLQKMTSEEWDRIVDTNLKGVFLSNRAILKTMIEQRSGQIINISSLSGRHALPFDSAYCASKFAVIGLTEALAEELRPYGVRVQAVLPGGTDTPIWRQNKLLPRAMYTLPVSRVANLIVNMIKWPEDSTLGEVAIAPLQTMPTSVWRTRSYGFGL
jgi:NAD(P)-dependent dehydrogenase (short-subunit alcohol dehydrogenase family)